MSTGQLREWLLGVRWAKAPGGGNALWQCEYCRDLVSLADLTVDHRAPLARGGSSRPENLAPCCRRCNEAKGNMSADGFRLVLTLPEADKTELFRRLRGGAIRRGVWAGAGSKG